MPNGLRISGPKHLSQKLGSQPVRDFHGTESSKNRGMRTAYAPVG